jgi:hypothetical protein
LSAFNATFLYLFYRLRANSSFSTQAQKGDNSTSQVKAGDIRSNSQIATGIAIPIPQGNITPNPQIEARFTTSISQNATGDAIHTSQTKAVNATTPIPQVKAINTSGIAQVSTRFTLAK